MSTVVVDPPVSRYSDPEEIEAWIRELDELIEAASEDEGARLAYTRAKSEAEAWLKSASPTQ